MALATVPGVIFSPSATKVPTPLNYLGDEDFNFLNQYMPELYNQIHNRFGSQELTGMLEQQGKEIPFASDNIKWKESARLTQLATGVTRSGNVFTSTAHTFRPNETLVVRNDDGSVLRQGLITATTDNTFTALCGEAADWTALGTTTLTIFADSNEFGKKQAGMTQSLNSQFESFEQSPVIIKEMIDESGSNMAQITWLQVSSDAGSGYIWYYQNYTDTQKRFKNSIENKLIRGKRWAGNLLAAGFEGTQGMFDIFSEGNVFEGAATDLDDFDSIIERCNAQGMIAENYLYNTTAQGAAIDDFLKAENVTGVSWGAFNNGEKEALVLGFKGFHRSGYNFYPSRWRYLDAPTTEGSMVGANKVHAVMIPSGSKNVYDVIKGESASQPMLHVRYRSKGDMNRKYQMSVRSFVAGTTNGVDEVITDFLTERALVVLGRNNTFIFKG